MFFGSVERPPRLSEFELEVPEKLIAQHPSKNRDECKLMIVDKETGDIQHKKFKDIIDYFHPGDVLVVNNTQVFSARLFAHKDKSDATVEVFLLRELGDDLWEGSVKVSFHKNGNVKTSSDAEGGGAVVISFDENGVYESGWGYNEMKDHFEKIVLSKDIKEFFLTENKDI